ATSGWFVVKGQLAVRIEQEHAWEGKYGNDKGHGRISYGG
ncbi:MAG: hypothetical protein QOE55_4652, partial [Acidobacteriaceae bacterium]|nr:hypothetical protein [Acidobacteriaceae bacterium]